MISLVFFLALLILFSNTFKHYHISKFLSIILLSFSTYLLSHFTSFEISLAISLGILILFTAYRIKEDGFKVDFENEAVFLSSFFFFLFLRSLVPDIIGAEKFMDSAFLNAVLRAKSFPPDDPFFAGGKLDVYYYFGQVISAVVVKLSLLPPEYGYNIAMAFVSGVSISIIHGFLREKQIGLIGIIPLIAGPPYALYELMDKLGSLKLPGFLFYWNSTRIIPDETFGRVITEFPYFSFIHADLHAHVVAIPLKLLFIATLYKFYRDGEYAETIPVLNFAIFATNSWDAPAFFLLSSILLIHRGKKHAIYALISAILMLAYKLEMNANARIFLSFQFSPISSFLLFWGFIAILLYFKIREEVRREPHILILALPSAIIPPFLFLPAAYFLAKRREFEDILAIFAIAFIFICEFVTIDFRMNTYFKFYLLSWVLLIPLISASLRELYESRKVIAIILILAMLVYPLIATPVRHYKAEFSLDGLKFMRESNPGDYYAIKWLYNKSGYIVEGVDGSYSYSGRISAFTGLPALIAWPNHEVHWRENGEEIAKRIDVVNRIYTSECSVSRNLAKKYNITFIIYGNYERERYGNVDFSCLEMVFESNGTKIFKVD